MNEDRIERALEGMLSAAEQAALEADVVRDPAVREAYVERAWLHATLRAQRETLPALLREKEAPVPAFRWSALAWPLALAACLVLAAAGAWRQRSVATLVAAENCRWAGSDLPTVVNAPLRAGTLALVEGMATLRFRNGATVTLEAPTRLRIVDAMHCRLLEGSVVAEVPEPAHGFTIDTADMKVKDLGTKFGLAASASGHSQVHVFKGEVEIGGLADGQTKRLKEGKGMLANSPAMAAGQEPVRAPAVAEEGGWTSIPTSFGRGRDGFVRRGHEGEGGERQPLLMVKHSDLPGSLNNERRAILTFDVSEAAAAKTVEAQLILEPEPSGYGFSTLVPDSRFALYGVTDEALDAWGKEGLKWDALPGCGEDGPVAAQTRRLAEFWIPRGGAGGPLVVRGEALAEFLRADTNGLVTFLLVRETGETDPTGLVHAFASREHPTARPPTLRLK